MRDRRFLTIDDVKEAARKVWPEAVEVRVGLSPTNSLSQKMYRVSALGERNRLLGRLDGSSVDGLKALLEKRVPAEAKVRRPAANVGSPTCANCGAPVQVVVSLSSEPGAHYVTVECQFCGKVQQELRSQEVER